MNDIEKYNELMSIYYEIDLLMSTRSVLSWDLETKIMPPSGLNHRGKQMALISNLIHKKMNEDRYKKLVFDLKDSTNLDYVQTRNVELLYRSVLTATGISAELVRKLSIQANKTGQSWKEAKTKKDFRIVEKDMTELFRLTIERAQLLADIKGFKDPLSALVSERDPGFDVNKLDKVFSETKSYLVPMLKKVVSSQDDPSFFNKDYSRETKVKISESVADFYNYDYNSENAVGRIGEVTHPLTMRLGPSDIRITVNYKDWNGMISATQHELGHALHGLNKNPEWTYTPINSGAAPSINEMTSRFTENKIGKDMAFWDGYYPKLKEIIDLKVDKNKFYNAFTHVNPGYLRMGADEISYGLHIIIRFEIEKDLFSEKLAYNEVPEVWRQKYNDYLDVDVKDDNQGCLQDLHWYSGPYIGYFQGYALGDLFGSQVYYHLQDTVPQWKNDLKDGNMDTVHKYLTKNVYSKGNLYDPQEFIKNITGKEFDTKYLKKYLEEKYL